MLFISRCMRALQALILHKIKACLLLKKRKYSATTSDNCFDFSRSDDDFKELAKGFQPKNTQISNCWALNIYIYSEWYKARREHMDELNLTKMSLLTDNRDTLGEH